MEKYFKGVGYEVIIFEAMEKHNYHIRINPYAVALVDEGCPQETIDALCKMSELVLKKYEDKSNVKTSVTSGGDGLVNLQTPPSFEPFTKEALENI